MFHTRRPRWFWSGSIGLVVVVAVVLVLWNTNRRPKMEATNGVEPVAQAGEHSASTVMQPLPADPLLATRAGAPLPPIDFPPGSIEDACGLNEFPSRNEHSDTDKEERYKWVNSPFNTEGEWKALESQECTEALERYISGVNPFLWGHTESIRNGAFAFIELENPLTFGRVFADPEGDFARVQEMLSRPECLLTQKTPYNWDLKDSCHAEALMNYAIIHRFCFDEGVWNRDRKYYWEEDNPTPEQDRFMWREGLESSWVRHKCEELDSTLEFTRDQYPELHQFVQPRQNHSTNGTLIPILFGKLKHFTSKAQSPSEILIELAARLGDESAGLTDHFVGWRQSYFEKGYMFGRLKGFLFSPHWRDLRAKREPSSKRLFGVLFLVEAAQRTETHMKFNWDWLAEHLCTAPYEDLSPLMMEPKEPPAEPKSCRVVVDELYARDDLSNSMLKLIDQFARTATELDVYD